nr:Mbeg1-like protein [uncultured Ruminococcus sp.]
MSSLTEYVRWYSEFSFYEKEFTDVDNLVLSQLAYYTFDLDKFDGEPAPLRRCASKRFQNDSFLQAVIQSRRFGTVKICDAVAVRDSKTSTQFAAITFQLYDNVYYIAFRGTDNTLVGWREDFMISYMKTDAQQRSVKYLAEHITEGNMYYVGGHSKGGNLALYGCCNLDDVRLGRVVRIYNNDGPGLCPEVSDVSLIDRISGRTTQIMPRYSVFGRLFAHDIKDTKIVTSSAENLMQHDIMTWEIKEGKLSLAKDFDPDSAWINAVADKWISDITTEEREKMTRIIFDTYDKDGDTTIEEALATGISGLDVLIKNMYRSDTLKTAAKIPEKVVFGSVFERIRKSRLAQLLKTNELREGIVFILFGVLMLSIPRNALQVIILVLLGGFAVFQLIYTFIALYKSKWNFEREKVRVYILVAAVTLFVLVLVKENAAFIVGSGVGGAWLLVVAYKSFVAAKKNEAHDFIYIIQVVKSVVYACCGIVILLAPLNVMQWVVLALGAIMVLDGIFTVVYTIIKANDRHKIRPKRKQKANKE